MENNELLNEVETIAPQVVFVDEKGRVLGITSIDNGFAVITEYNCSMALNEDGFAKYKYINGEVVERTEEEIERDRLNVPMEEPSQLDRIEAQVLFTALLTDTLIEEE